MGEKITVVGAGPVGSLLALFLARRGHEVEVIERRPDMRRVDIAAGRSINLAVSTRGLYALHQMGLDREVLAQSVPMLGRIVHAGGETRFLRYGRDDSEFINSMSRGELNKLLMTEAERTGKVRIRFETRLAGYDLAQRRARLRDERTGAEQDLDAPVIFGSDGSASALRRALSPETKEEVLDFGYKELTLPSGPRGAFLLAKDGLHIWPRKNFMLIALPNVDGTFTCTLFLPFQGEPSFASIDGEEDGFLADTFPDAQPLIPEAGRALRDAPLGRMATVRCSPWARGSALLVGDAAHAIVPFFGQGMNAGFEDCTVLDAILSRQPDWERAFAELSSSRKPDADAIADLALENFAEMRDKVADPQFVLWKSVEAELQRRFPGEYLSRYQLVTFTRVPYRVALEAGRIQQRLLRTLTASARRAEDVDYSLAQELIRSELAPLLRSHPSI
ncbi:MAG TPA: NAD(P)/FAD-dependent oxidoreductase [Thermoanaerobaculia bacterium]